MAPVDLLSQNAPPGSTREDRVALLLAAAYCLRTGEPVPTAAARLLGEALDDWLKHGGRLETRFRINRRGDHRNAQAIAARLAEVAAPKPSSSTMRDIALPIGDSRAEMKPEPSNIESLSRRRTRGK